MGTRQRVSLCAAFTFSCHGESAPGVATSTGDAWVKDECVSGSSLVYLPQPSLRVQLDPARTLSARNMPAQDVQLIKYRPRLNAPKVIPGLGNPNGRVHFTSLDKQNSRSGG